MKRRRKIIIVFTGLFLVIAGAWAVTMCVIPAMKVSAYKRSLIARGEELEIAELVPPTVPREQNGADTVQAAINLLTRETQDESNLVPSMRLILPGKAVVCFEQPNVRDTDFTNSWPNEMAVVADARPVTESLIRAMNYPTIDFHRDYNNEMNMLLNNLYPLRQCERRLATEAICSLHNMDAAKATTNICAILSLVNGERDERVPISQLVRIAMASDAAGVNWELLQSTNVDDEELTRLQEMWESLEFVQAADNAVLMDRAGMESELRRLRHSSGYFKNAGLGGLHGPSNIWDEAKLDGTWFTWRILWSYPDELITLRGDQAILDALRSASTNHSFYPSYTNMTGQLAALGIPDWGEDAYLLMDIDLPNLFSREVPDRASIVYRVMSIEATKRIVITAIALKRHQLKYGNYPAALSDLTPEFLPSILLDPIDGKPLRYRLNADGTFLLYSVGFNGKDDGGNPTGEKVTEYLDYFWPTPHSLDWVWPQPATPEGIEDFYAHPPK